MEVEVKRLNSDLDLLTYSSKHNVIFAPKIKHKFYTNELSPISPFLNYDRKQNSSTILKKINLLTLDDKKFEEPQFIANKIKRKTESKKDVITIYFPSKIIISSKKEEEDFLHSDFDFSESEIDDEDSSISQIDNYPYLHKKFKAPTILDKLEEIILYSKNHRHS